MCDCDGTGLQNMPFILCVLGHWELCPWCWHSEFGAMGVWLNGWVLGLFTALWHLQEFLENWREQKLATWWLGFSAVGAMGC